MINLMKAETFKLQRNKTFWALISTITGLSTMLHYLVVIDWWQLSGTEFEQNGLTEMNALSVFILPVLFNLIVSSLAGFYISTEFSQSSVIKNQIISGNKRTRIYLAKYLTFSLGAFIIAILIPLLTGMIMVILCGHGEILNLSSLTYLGRAFCLFTLQFLCFTAVVVMISIVTEDSGKTILFTLLLTIVMFIIEKFVPFPLIKGLYEYTFFYQFGEVFKATMTNSEIVKSIVVGIVSFMIFIGWGGFIFNRKEIK